MTTNYTINETMNLIDNICDMYTDHLIRSGWAGPRYCITDYISALLDPSEKQSCLDDFSKCKCCHRHQQKRPIKYEPWLETEHYEKNETPLCLCHCRHNARIICRSCK